MGDRRRRRPGAGRAGTGQPARRASGDDRDERRATDSAKPAGARALRALNPRKAPTRSRVRTAALLFAGLAVVLGILGLTVNRGYLQPAVLLALLALLWGVRALIMR